MSTAEVLPDLNPPTKSKKAPKPPKAAKAPKAPKDDKEAGAPRPRVWQYGIAPDSVVSKVEGATPKVRKDTLAAYEALVAPMTCEEFMAKGATRHDIRVLCRSGLVTITASDGTVYPKKL